VKAIAAHVLRHRAILAYKAEAEDVLSKDVVRPVLKSIPVL
jgi:hypothetical protein